MKRFDVLVIGSGMGGLCTAARLAEQGFRVLVIESAARIGGRCSTHCRDGFKLATGVVGIERRGLVEDFFGSLGLPFDVRPADDLRILIGNKQVAVTRRGGMKRLLSAAGAEMMAVERVMETISRGLTWHAPASSLPLKQWLDQYTHDERLVQVFQTLASASLMMDIEEISVSAFFDFIRHFNGIPRFGYAPRGAIALPEALEGYILKNRGEIWTRAEAIRILIENNAVRGALIRHLGKEESVEASVVVSNAGPHRTAALAGRKNFDADDLHLLDATVRPAHAICMQIAVERPCFEHSHLWVTGCRRIRRIHQPTRICPELAPPGRHLLIGLATVPGSLRSIDLEAETAVCRDDLARLIPGFETKAEVLAVDAFFGDRPAMHAWPGRDAPIKTSVINLYNVGDGNKSPGFTGLPAVVEAAERVASDILRRISRIHSIAAGS